MTSWPRRVLVMLIELYRTWISPTRLPSCRFEPTCSAYAVEAISTWGAGRGGALSLWRLAKCGPWHRPGYDPVPERHRGSGHDGQGVQTRHRTEAGTSEAADVESSEEQVTPC